MVAGAPDATVKRMRLPRRTALPARQCPGELAYYPYLLGGLAIEWVNQVWCADVTYIPMAKRFLYLVVIMDWMSRAATFEHARCRLLCIRPISDAFIMLIRSVVPLIIFATVAVGIAKTGDMRRVGVVRLRAIIYFEVVSSLALLVGLTVGNRLQLGTGLHIILTRLADCITSVPTASPMPSSCCSSAPRTGRIFASSRHECGQTAEVQPLPGGDRGHATLTETRTAEWPEG